MLGLRWSGGCLMATFTDKFIRGLKPADHVYEERDAGCPGLILRVGKRGRKVWEVVVSRDGRRRRVRLGVYPDMSLAEARRTAGQKKDGPAIHSGNLRVRELWEDYEREIKGTRRAWRDVAGVWAAWAEPIIGGVRLEDLNMRHGAELIAHVTKHSTPNRARKVIRYLSPMLTFAAGRGLIAGNPWAGLHLPEGVQRRDRVLSREEWLAVWRWAEAAPEPWGPFLRALMLSAQRLGEVAGMQWAELDLAAGIWIIPAERHKSGKRHEVPLSRALATLLKAQKRHDAYIFSTRKDTPIAPGAKLIRAIHRETGTAGWRFHDLRRTGSTLMGEGGVTRFIIERVLGHADHTVTAIYDRATYRDEKRQALEVLAGTVRDG